MAIHQHATLGDTVYFWFGANDTAGSGNDGASAAADVRLAGAAVDAAPVLSPSPVLLTHANYPAGAYEVPVAATSGNGFAAGSTYAVFCTLTVGAQNPTGFVGSFMLGPVVANSIQWLGQACAAVTTAGVPEVDLTYIAGAAVSAASAQLGVNVVQISADATAADNAELMFDGTGYAGGITKLDVNLVQILAAAITGTAALIVAAFTKFFNIATPTGTINSLPDAVPDAAGGLPVTGTRLTAIPWNSTWDAEIESEANDALVANNLDHMALTAAAIPAIPAGTYIDQMMDDGTATFDRATDSLQAIRDRGDSAWDTADVSALALQASVDDLEGRLTAARAGYLDNLSAGAVATAAALAVVDDFVDTEVSVIKGVTDKLDTALELDGAVYRLTTNALELAPGGSAPTVAQIDTQLSSTHGSGAWGGAAGSGSVTWSYTLTSTVNATPIADADITVYSNASMTALVASGRTNASGIATFYLNPGTYYIKRVKTGWNFTNPDTEVVT